MSTDPPLVTREDIEQGFRDIQGEISEQVDGAKPRLVSAGLGLALLLLFVAYLLGRRVGKTKSTVVEIRRI